MEKKILPAGDAALVVEFGREISDELNEQVHLLAGAMKRSASDLPKPHGLLRSRRDQLCKVKKEN